MQAVFAFGTLAFAGACVGATWCLVTAGRQGQPLTGSDDWVSAVWMGMAGKWAFALWYHARTMLRDDGDASGAGDASDPGAYARMAPSNSITGGDV